MKYDSVAIGNRAIIARNSKNLRQKNVSDAIGMHQATYSKFELGQYDPHVSQLIKLCDYLDVSINWLLGVDIIPDLTDKERLELETFKKFLIARRTHSK